METLQIIGIVMLCIGIVLVAIEAFIPGFGVTGISGIICLIIGALLTGRSIEERITIIVILVVVTSIFFVVGLVVINSKKIKPPIVLDEDLKAGNNFLSENDMEYFIGKKGYAITDLKPLGKGEFDGVKLEVISEGQYIKKDTKLVITKIENNKMVVKEEK